MFSWMYFWTCIAAILFCASCHNPVIPPIFWYSALVFLHSAVLTVNNKDTCLGVHEGVTYKHDGVLEMSARARKNPR